MGFELMKGSATVGESSFCTSSRILWDSILVGGTCVLFMCGMDDMIRLPYEHIPHNDILSEIRRGLFCMPGL